MQRVGRAFNARSRVVNRLRDDRHLRFEFTRRAVNGPRDAAELLGAEGFLPIGKGLHLLRGRPNRIGNALLHRVDRGADALLDAVGGLLDRIAGRFRFPGRIGRHAAFLLVLKS